MFCLHFQDLHIQNNVLLLHILYIRLNVVLGDHRCENMMLLVHVYAASKECGLFFWPGFEFCFFFFFNYVGNLLELLLCESYFGFSGEHACGVYVTTIHIRRANKASTLLRHTSLCSAQT